MAALAACGGGQGDISELHAVTDCDAPPAQCETACAAFQQSQPGTCTASNPVDPDSIACNGTIEVDGVVGCCDASLDDVVRFYECE